MSVDDGKIEVEPPVARKAEERPGIVLLLTSVAALIVILGFLFAATPGIGTVYPAEGEFYINDAGTSHGGFEYAGSFNASVHEGSDGWKLSMSLRIGLGDPLSMHHIRIYSLEFNSTEMVMDTERGEMILRYVEEDFIWGDMFSQMYVAIYSPEGPPEESIGEISAQMFDLPVHYYVQLALTPIV
ncbi:MAG: hypothetical protein OEV21_04885 [Thermoplasmata archaeon]|nr:hypothetical protein [Thermoplasmata archaeon]